MVVAAYYRGRELIYDREDVGELVAQINCPRDGRKYYETLVGYVRAGARYYDLDRVMKSYVDFLLGTRTRE